MTSGFDRRGPGGLRARRMPPGRPSVAELEARRERALAAARTAAEALTFGLALLLCFFLPGLLG